MENSTSSTPKKRNPLPLILLALVIGTLGFFGVRAVIHGMKYETTDNAQIETHAVPVVARVSGYIDSLFVGDYSQVKSGNPVIKIDDREYVLAIRQAEADLMTAQADLASAESGLKTTQANKQLMQANLNVQQVRLDKALTDLKRDEALFNDGAITKRQFDDSKSNLDAQQKQLYAAQEQVKLANSQLATSDAAIQKTRALILTRQTMIEQAQLRASYTDITAPVSGRVGQTNLEPGQLVAQGQTLFNIVDETEFWVVANFKETQLQHLKVGQEVEVKLDGYPKLEVKGKISDFSLATGAKFALLPPDNASGNFVKVTQRVPVKISITNLEEVRPFLKAGLSAEVEVNIQ